MSFGKSPDSWLARSLKATHYTTALADGVIDIEDITTPRGMPTPSVVVSRITIWADQNIAWDVSLWRDNDSQPTADHDTHGLIDFVSFAITDGIQFGGAGPYLYSLSNMAIRVPTDGSLWVGLAPRGAAKNAGATGETVIELSGPVM